MITMSMMQAGFLIILGVAALYFLYCVGRLGIRAWELYRGKRHGN